MKRFLQLICLLLVSTVCFSQSYLKPNNYYGSQFDRAWFPQALHIPIGDTVLNTTKLTAGALLFRTTGGDSTLYAWDGIKWLSVGGASVSYAAGNGISVDSLALGRIVWADTLYRNTFISLVQNTTFGLQYTSIDSAAAIYVGKGDGQYNVEAYAQNDSVTSNIHAGVQGVFIQSFGAVSDNEHGVDARSRYNPGTGTPTGTYIFSTDSIYFNNNSPTPVPDITSNAYHPTTGTTTGYKAVLMDEWSGALVTANPGIIGGSSLFPLTGTGTATGNVTGDLDGNTLRFANAPSVGIYDDANSIYVHQWNYTDHSIDYISRSALTGNAAFSYSVDSTDNRISLNLNDYENGNTIIEQSSSRNDGTKVKFRLNNGDDSFIWENGTGQLNPNIVFTASGTVGIGTPTPTEALDVNGNIVASGTITPSDRRYKEKIAPLNNSLALLLSLKPATYYYKKTQGKNFPKGLQFGLIAQEVEKTIPEIVKTNKDGYKNLNYTELIPVLIGAIQEQQKEIELLKKQVKALKK